MTEADWLLGENVVEMFGAVERLVTRRTGRLFAAACVRTTPIAAGHELLGESADAAEAFADDPTEWPRLGNLHHRANELCHAVELDSVAHMLALAALRLTDPNLHHPFHVPFFLRQAASGSGGADREVGAAHCDILRDVVFNPFRGTRGFVIRTPRKSSALTFFAPAWRTEAAVGIAARMYDSREFGNAPVLADALQDAGCEHADTLAHLRGPGPHVRGCWAVDLVLGKK